MEQQLVVRLPDTTAMKAVARIGEHQAVKLRVDKDKPMRGTVKIVGRPEPLGASITNMSVLSDNMQRWWNPELKEFPVDLALDTTPQGLKPGTTCAVEILVEHIPSTLAVPVAAIYTHGPDSYVFVREGDRVIERKVKVGASNDTHIQISEGLSRGEQVMILQAGQGRELLNLPETPPTPATQPAVPEKPTGLAQVQGSP
jgi:hypothetical protein